MSMDITDELIARQTPEAQAIIRLLIAKIAELEARLNETPQNSSLPPSTQHPHSKTLTKKVRSRLRPGGQPGRRTAAKRRSAMHADRTNRRTGMLDRKVSAAHIASCRNPELFSRPNDVELGHRHRAPLNSRIARRTRQRNRTAGGSILPPS